MTSCPELLFLLWGATLCKFDALGNSALFLALCRFEIACFYLWMRTNGLLAFAFLSSSLWFSSSNQLVFKGQQLLAWYRKYYVALLLKKSYAHCLGPALDFDFRIACWTLLLNAAFAYVCAAFRGYSCAVVWILFSVLSRKETTYIEVKCKTVTEMIYPWQTRDNEVLL